MFWVDMMIPALSLSLLPIFVIIAATGDVLYRRISNRLVLFMIIAFFPMALATGLPLEQIGIHTLVAVLFFLLGFLLFSFGIFGGGDAKLLAAIGLWLGNDQLTSFALFTGLAGGVVAMIIGLWSLVVLDGQIKGWRLADKASKVKPSVPYGYALAAGAIAVLPSSWWAHIPITIG